MTLQEATEKVQGMSEMHAGKFNNKVIFQLDEGMIFLDDSVTPAIVSNEVGSVECTIKISLDNFEKMLGGEMNPMMAFMTGKMKIDGDKGVAMKLASLF